MKTATFTYTDVKGKVTDRKILVTSMPSDMIEGIDTADMTDEDVVSFRNCYEELYSEFLANLSELKIEHDCRFAFRTFYESNCRNLVIE